MNKKWTFGGTTKWTRKAPQSSRAEKWSGNELLVLERQKNEKNPRVAKMNKNELTELESRENEQEIKF